MRMMFDFKRCISICVIKEGGKSTDPDDSGNWTGGKVNGKGVGILKGTNKGISAKAYPHLDIMKLTDEQIEKIYYNDYWLKIKGDILPEKIRLHVLDFSITSGVSSAIKALQGASGIERRNVDGIFGTQTLGAMHNANPWTYQAERRRYYVLISRADTKKLKYLSGWLDRNESITKICLEG